MSVSSYSPVQLHCDDESSDNKNCSETVSQSTSVEKHRQINLSEGSFHCSTDDTSFGVSESVKKQMRIHSEEKMTHMRLNSGEKTFKCSDCGKTLSRSSHLKVHMRIHSGEKPFKCRDCGKTFSQSGVLKVHMQLHSGEKTFKCRDCGKTLSRSSHLKVHMRIHSGEKPFKCRDCGKTFSRSGVLKRHMQLHSGEKPFKCRDCGKTFSRSGVLKRHMQLHSGEKPFKCRDSGKDFRYQRNFRRHSRVHVVDASVQQFGCELSGETSAEVRCRTVAKNTANLTEKNRCGSATEAAVVDIKVEEEPSSLCKLPVPLSPAQFQDSAENKTQWCEVSSGTVSHPSSDSHSEDFVARNVKPEYSESQDNTEYESQNVSTTIVKTEYCKPFDDWKLLVWPFVKLTRLNNCDFSAVL